MTALRPSRALHGPLDPPYRWACSEPERPSDGLTVYDGQCRRCRIKLDVDLALEPNMVMEHVHVPGDIRPVRVWLAESDRVMSAHDGALS